MEMVGWVVVEWGEVGRGGGGWVGVVGWVVVGWIRVVGWSGWCD